MASWVFPTPPTPTITQPGGDELRASALKSGRFDYDTPIPGLEVVDRYTLRIRLKEPYYTFLYMLAIPASAAIARQIATSWRLAIVRSSTLA